MQIRKLETFSWLILKNYFHNGIERFKKCRKILSKMKKWLVNLHKMHLYIRYCVVLCSFAVSCCDVESCVVLCVCVCFIVQSSQLVLAQSAHWNVCVCACMLCVCVWCVCVCWVGSNGIKHWLMLCKVFEDMLWCTNSMANTAHINYQLSLITSTYIHTYIRTYIHTYTHTYINTIHTYTLCYYGQTSIVW